MRRLATALILICYSMTPIDAAPPNAAPPNGELPDAAARSSRAKRALEGWEASPDAGSSNSAGKEKITSREKKLATNSFLRPFRAGHWDTVVSNARKILPRRESEQIDALSTYLQQASSITLPSMLTTARIQLARSGVKNIPQPLPVEANLIGTKLQDVLDAKLRSAREAGPFDGSRCNTTRRPQQTTG